jgi:F-type H+-transporting ATPase subunit alpha
VAAFAQFGSDLDKATQAQLSRGQRLTEILKQGQYVPVPVERQVLIIYAAANGFLDSVSLEDSGRYERDLYKFMDLHHQDLMKSIVEKGSLDDELKGGLKKALDTFKNEFVAASATTIS